MESFRQFMEGCGNRDRHLTDLEVIGFYRDNPQMRVKEIAQMTGRSLSELYRTLQRYNVNPSRVKESSHLVKMYSDQGYSSSQIAELTGYTSRNIRYILSKLRLQD